MKRPDLSAKQYHQDPEQPAYQGQLDDAVFKRSEQMAVVNYDRCHANDDEAGLLAGQGLTRSTWVFSEDGNKAEGLSQCGLDLVIDFTMAPNASVGMHKHDDKEEVYYLLEGELTLIVETLDGVRKKAILGPGDAHLIKLGQSHAAIAGSDGARIMAMCVKA